MESTRVAEGCASSKSSEAEGVESKPHALSLTLTLILGPIRTLHVEMNRFVWWSNSRVLLLDDFNFTITWDDEQLV